MTALELHNEAMNLPDRDRAQLAASLLESLPAVLVKEDDGVAEAWRRDEAMERDPSASISWDELKKNLRTNSMAGMS